MRRFGSAVIAIAMVIAPLHVHVAAAGEARPSQADLQTCHELAREQGGVPSYVERTPASPFPSRISGVGPWTGPVTGVPPPRLTPRRDPRPPIPVDPPGVAFGAGGNSQEGSSDTGPVDPRYREAFDACMRALGY